MIDAPLLKKTCVRQVVLGKWSPLNEARHLCVLGSELIAIAIPIPIPIPVPIPMPIPRTIPIRIPMGGIPTAPERHLQEAHLARRPMRDAGHPPAKMFKNVSYATLYYTILYHTILYYTIILQQIILYYTILLILYYTIPAPAARGQPKRLALTSVPVYRTSRGPNLSCVSSGSWLSSGRDSVRLRFAKYHPRQANNKRCRLRMIGI